MFLSEVLDQLSHGELFSLGVRDLSSEENKNRIISAINLGLTDLHKRFWLREGNVTIRVQPGTQVTLDTNCTTIVSSYEGDLLKIERIFNLEGEYQPLNDEYAEYSFFTPRFNIIKVPVDYTGSSILVEYRANHPKITSECPADSTVVDISLGILQALLLFVGSRVMTSMSPDQAQESMNLLQQYEAECVKLKALSYEVVPDRTNCKLDTRGWV